MRCSLTSGAITVLVSSMLWSGCKAHRPYSGDMTIETSIYFPVAICDGGTAYPNWEIPAQGGPQVTCIRTGGQRIALPDGQAVDDETGFIEIGTVIVMSYSRDQVLLAADSRSSLFDRTGRFAGIDDGRCKVVQLTPTLLFAATGMTKTGESFPSNVLYDAQELARLAAREFQPDAVWVNQNQAIKEIAAQWADALASRIRRGVEGGWYRPFGPTWITGIFAGLELNGEIAVSIARLRYGRPRRGWTVPPASIAVEVPVPPTDFTWLEAYGRKGVAEQYIFRQKITDETIEEHKRIRSRQLQNPRHFPSDLVRKLVEISIEDDEFEWPDGSKAVGGYVDVAKLVKGSRIEWVRRKQVCTRATTE